MSILKIAEFDNTVVLHFEVQESSISAYTLASTLTSIADAAAAANRSLNLGTEIEVLVEALGSGSFRAKIRTIQAKAKGFISTQVIPGVIVGVLTSYVYDRTIAREDGVQVIINTDEVIIEHGDDRIVVPRNVHDSMEQAKKNPEFRGAITRTLEAVSRDEAVSGLGFVKRMDSPKPEVMIERVSMVAATELVLDSVSTRVIEKEVVLRIIKAVLVPGKRKWEFEWEGIKVTAPILDLEFQQRFVEHEVKIAPADVLRCTLRIHQVGDVQTGLFMNSSYEVLRVHEHVPRVEQLDLSDFYEGS